MVMAERRILIFFREVFVYYWFPSTRKCREINDFTALFGGLEGDRTLDLRVANAALSRVVR